MSITYPLTMPESPCFLSDEFGPITAVAMSRSPFNFQTQRQALPGQMWAFSGTLPPLQGPEAAEWKAFLVALNGREGSFLLRPPSFKLRGVGTGTPLVKGGSQTGRELVTDGWTSGVTGILKAGDYLQLGTGASSRLHMVVKDADSDGSGNATLDIWPALRASPADNDPIEIEDPHGVFMLTSNELRWTRDIIFNGIAFDAVEVV